MQNNTVTMSGITLQCLLKGNFCQWVDFCPDGKNLVTVGDANIVHLVSVDSGDIVRSFSGHNDAVKWIDCSPDGRLLATASFDNTVRLWDMASTAELNRLQLNPKVEELVFSNNGKQLIVYALMKHIRTYEINELINKMVTPFATEHFECPAYGGMAVSPDGQRIATALWDNRILMSDSEYNKLVYSKGHSEFACTLSFNADGTRLASTSTDRTVRLWDTLTGREILVLDKPYPFNRNISFDRSGKKLITGNNNTRLRVFDATPFASQRSIKPSVTLHGHTTFVGNVNYSPDGSRLLSTSPDSGVYIWDIPSGQKSILPGIDMISGSAQFSTKGEWITAVGVQQGSFVVKVWDATYPYAERFSHEQQRELAAVTFSADSRFVIFGGDEGVLYVYDWKKRVKIGELDQQHLFVSGITASPDERYLASTGLDGSVTLWDATRLGEPQHRHIVYKGGPTFFGARFSPDSKRLAVGGREGDIVVIDIESDECLKIPNAHGDFVSCVSFSPNGKYLASCGADQTVRIWDTEACEQVDIFLGHQGPVTSVAFSPDGKHVASAGYDTTIRIWTPRLK